MEGAPVVVVEEKLDNASVKDLHAFLKAKNVDSSSCIEKSEVVAKVNEALEKEGLKVADFFAWKQKNDGKHLLTQFKFVAVNLT